MNKKRRRKRLEYALLLLLTLAVGLVFGMISSSRVSPLQSVLGTVFYPLQKLSSAVYSYFSDLGASYKSSSVYAERVAELESTIDDYREQLVDYDRLKQKNELYADFLEIKEENPDFSFVSCSVISRDRADIYGSFVINKGSSDGIKTDQPVIYGKNLVGIVRSVSQKTAVISTLFDPEVNMSAYELTTHEEGVVGTDPSLAAQKLLKLSLLPPKTSVRGGGVVCTSGAGGVYPEGLLIGTVTLVANESSNVSSYALIKPAADIDTVTDVFVITGFEGQGEYR